MLEVGKIRQYKEEIGKALLKRGRSFENDLTKIIDLDQKRRETQTERDSVQQEANAISKEIGKLMSSGNREEAEKVKANVGNLKSKAKDLELKVSVIETDLNLALTAIPNIPFKRVPGGVTEDDNEVLNEGGNIPELGENPLSHWDLADKYGIIDFQLGVKITGAGFPVYRGKGSKMQRAMISYFLDQAGAEGYTEYQPPLMVNEASGFGTGQLPDKEGQMYHVTVDDLYLIPTAEVPLTNLYRDDILDIEDLPVKLTGYSQCFRREAGSYGKDVRGLNRLHQFDKVEIVQIVDPENSYDVLEKMRVYITNLVESLGLPYRTLRLCGGDLGFAAAMTYDLETYSAAQKRWLEVSSVSNFETYQSNRLKLRLKDANGKKQLVHTLNGSALALPRIFATILENYQTPEGIVVPEVLRPYTGFNIID